MEELFTRIYENMVDRVSGPMHFRLILQPAMAAIFGIIGGMRDAKAGKPAYFWAMFTQAEHRRDMLKDGWKAVGKVFVLGLVLDIIYQIIVEKWVYPFEVVLVAFILALVPYLMLRGIANHIASLFMKR